MMGARRLLGDVAPRSSRRRLVTPGNPIIFRVDHRPGLSAVIYSCGANGKTKPTPRVPDRRIPKSYYYFGGTAGDDISNL